MIAWLPGVERRESPNHGGPMEPLLGTVIHYTAGGAFAATCNWLCSRSARVSAHFVIGRAGELAQLVPLDVQAWHAGESEWPPTPPERAALHDCNRFSLGIELCNWGPLTGRSIATASTGMWTTTAGTSYRGPTPIFVNGQAWEPYPEAQLDALCALLLRLRDEHDPQAVRQLVGHEDIAPGRKRDPGPHLPWARVRATVAVPAVA